jgi:small subunit ribosomal protein S21
LHPKNNMIHVNIKDGDSLEKALRKFKKKFDKTGVIKEIRARQAFEKPCVAKRMELIRARYKQKMQSESLD